jgi:hypothetical protein
VASRGFKRIRGQDAANHQCRRAELVEDALERDADEGAVGGLSNAD